MYERTTIAHAPGMHLMIGLLISGRNRDPAWESSRYPRYGDFKDMMNVRGNTFVTLHMDAKKSDLWYLDLLYFGDKFPLMGFDGFQINVKHPDPLDIVSLKNQFPDKKIILQYSKEFLTLCPECAVQDLEPYSRFIDFVLIDPSRGRGESLNLEVACDHYHEIKTQYPALGVGFAGGFTPESISSTIWDLKKHTNMIDFSIDIETGVRDAEDKLDLAKVEKYITEAARTYHDSARRTCRLCQNNYSEESCEKCATDALDFAQDMQDDIQGTITLQKEGS